MKGKPRRVPGEGYEGVSVQKLENQPGARGHGAPTPGQRGAKRSELAIRAAARKGSGARGRRQEEDNGPAQGKLSVWQRERLRREGLAVLPSLRGLRPGSPRAAWDAKAAEPPGTGT